MIDNEIFDSCRRELDNKRQTYTDLNRLLAQNISLLAAYLRYDGAHHVDVTQVVEGLQVRNPSPVPMMLGNIAKSDANRFFHAQQLAEVFSHGGARKRGWQSDANRVHEEQLNRRRGVFFFPNTMVSGGDLATRCEHNA